MLHLHLQPTISFDSSSISGALGIGHILLSVWLLSKSSDLLTRLSNSGPEVLDLSLVHEYIWQLSEVHNFLLGIMFIKICGITNEAISK